MRIIYAVRVDVPVTVEYAFTTSRYTFRTLCSMIKWRNQSNDNGVFPDDYTMTIQAVHIPDGVNLWDALAAAGWWQ